MLRLSKPMNVIDIRVTIPHEYIEDVLTTAFEGGINHWCGGIERLYPNQKNYTLPQVITHDGTLIVYEDELIGTKGYKGKTLTMFKVMNGIKKLINEQGHRYLDAGDVDADIADTIIQYALFGRLVYS